MQVNMVLDVCCKHPILMRLISQKASCFALHSAYILAPGSADKMSPHENTGITTLRAVYVQKC